MEIEYETPIRGDEATAIFRGEFRRAFIISLIIHKHEKRCRLQCCFSFSDKTYEWRELLKVLKKESFSYDKTLKTWFTETINGDEACTRRLCNVIYALTLSVTEIIYIKAFSLEAKQMLPVANLLPLMKSYVKASYLDAEKNTIYTEDKTKVKVRIEGSVAMCEIRVRPVSEVPINKHHNQLWAFMKYGIEAHEVCRGGVSTFVTNKVKELCAFAKSNADTVQVEGVQQMHDYPEVVFLEPRLYKHQKEGIRHLAYKKYAILADDMGLGKTAQAILAAEQAKVDDDINSIIIVCPVSLMQNWRNELVKWQTSFKSVQIIPYSQIHKYDQNKLYRNAIMIIDECHYLKNPTARRTTSLIMLLENNPYIKRVWLLSGTPVTKDNADLWTLGHICHSKFTKEFSILQLKAMKGEFNGRLIAGAFADLMLMRKKEDCLDLPEKITQVVEVDTNIPVDYEILKAGSAALINEHLMRIKRMAAEAKVSSTIDIVENILESGKKVIVFSDHTAPLEKLEAKFRNKCVRLDGKTPSNHRQTLVDKFQNDEKCKVFLGNMTAAGVGINLTASSYVVFNDLTWLPSTVHQATDRAYRIGQKNTVNVYYVLDMGLITDKIISKILAERSTDIASFERSDVTVLSVLKEVLG